MASKPRVAPPASPSGDLIRDSALGRSPETLDAFVNLNRSVWRQGPLPPALLELARLTNARHVNCVFCKSVRYDIARADGLTEDKIDQIDHFRDSSLSQREQAVIAFSRAYLDNPGGDHPSLRSEMRALFSPQEIAHLATALASFNAFSKCAVALGGMPDELPVTEISLPG